MLLGDGTLWTTPTGYKGIFQLCHGPKQYDYLVWKRDLVNSFFEGKNSSKRMREIRHVKMSNGYDCYIATLSWQQYFRILYKWCYPNRRKSFEFLLSQTSSPLHLAIWLMDDGSEAKRKTKHLDGTEYLCNPYYILELGKCSEGEANLAIQWFSTNFLVNPKKLVYKTHCWRLRFTAPETKQLFYKCGKFFNEIPSMRNKFWLSFMKYQFERPNTLSREDIVHNQH